VRESERAAVGIEGILTCETGVALLETPPSDYAARNLAANPTYGIVTGGFPVDEMDILGLAGLPPTNKRRRLG